MTKEITKAFILQQMQDKLGLREFEPLPFLFSETVTPIYNIEPHLEHWYTNLKTVSITSAAPFLFFVVPKTERWRVRRYDVIFLASGAYTVAGVYTSRTDKLSAGSTVYLDLGAAKSASYHIDLVEPVQMEAGDALNINIDGYTSTADLRLIIDYEVEDIR